MFPIILFALGLSALAAYSFSSQVRSRVDDYARAIRTAHDAHRAADVHLSNAHRVVGSVGPVGPVGPVGFPAQPRMDGTARDVFSKPPLPVPAGPPSPETGIDHAIAATVENQRAAQSTTEAASLAKTATERAVAAESADRVLERGKKISKALANLGVGQCGLRSYARVTPRVRDAILEKLHAEGMTVTGNDPWDIDTQLAGVKLRAVWDPGAQVLKLIVTASSLLAPCSVIWERIERALQGIIGP